MAVRLYNTLTRSKEEFTPLNEGEVRLYNCGPTIYNYAHIGNFRAYVCVDLLRRHLEYRGFRVTQVTNLTDVEDKIIRTCREQGVSLQELTDTYKQAFFDDLAALGVKPAEHYPAATGHIDDIVALIQKLQANGHTYEAGGSIYFRLSSFPEYGQLSHYQMDELRSGASGRVDADEYEIEDARDFVLWKAHTEDDGDVYWDTPLGKGRPGWHIECSAMSMRYLGPTFDIHCGGEDLVFPHHENEIAQSTCATGQPFVRYWVHNAYLIVENKKMSKSLGNFFTLRDLLAKGYNPLAIRWVLLATHYRMPNNFTFDALDAADKSLQRIRDFRLRLGEIKGEGAGLKDEAAKCEQAFAAALDDDLNIAGALAAVFDFIRDTNRLMDAGALGAAGAARALALLDRLDAVTGLFAPPLDDAVPQDVTDRVLARQEARRNKDFAQADALRDALAAEGWVIEDTPDGPRVKRA